MPKFYVEKDIVINKPMDEVHAVIRDFKKWPIWSPWLVMEPDVALDYSGTQGEVGAAYTWDGEMLGKGQLSITAISEQLIDMELLFLTPFKSRARTYFTLLPVSDKQTRVIWHMEGSMPFFMFFMTRKMAAWIGMDYFRGLKMLREYMETGAVSSKVEVIEDSYLQGTRYLGISASCKISELGQFIPGHLRTLGALLADKDLPVDVVPFVIYHKMDIVNDIISFTSAVPVPHVVDCPSDIQCSEFRGGHALQINHTGRYEHLGNAWATASTYARSKKIKLEKKPMGIEFYINNPDEVSEGSLLTEVFMRLR